MPPSSCSYSTLPCTSLHSEHVAAAIAPAAEDMLLQVYWKMKEKTQDLALPQLLVTACNSVTKQL